MENRPISIGSDLSQRRKSGKFPKSELIYMCQVVALYMVIIVCLVNLTIGTDNNPLWSSLLSGGIGYLLPSPKIRKRNDAFLSNIAE